MIIVAIWTLSSIFVSLDIELTVSLGNGPGWFVSSVSPSISITAIAYVASPPFLQTTRSKSKLFIPSATAMKQLWGMLDANAV